MTTAILVTFMMQKGFDAGIGPVEHHVRSIQWWSSADIAAKAAQRHPRSPRTADTKVYRMQLKGAAVPSRSSFPAFHR
jgi:hypothetical protein